MDATDRKDQNFRRKRDDDLGLFGPNLGIGSGSQLLPRGVVHGQRISALFESLLAARTRTRDFDQLPVPYRAVTADIESGEAVVIGAGSLSLAMRAGMSVPGAFDPVEWDGRLLVDGGIANNLPVDVVRSLGAEVVVAVEVGTPPATRETLRTAPAFVSQLSNLMINRNSSAQIATLGEGDLLIRPELGNLSAAGFEKVDEAVLIGYAAALEASPALSRYSIPEGDYARYRAALEACAPGAARVEFVEIDNRSRFADEVSERRVAIEPGDVVDDELDLTRFPGQFGT